MTPARHPLRWSALGLAAALTACGGGGGGDTVTIDTSNDRGSIQRNPPTQLVSLTNVGFTSSLRTNVDDGTPNQDGRRLLQLIGVDPTGDTPSIPTKTVTCGIDLRYLQYGTVGGAGERTNATGALMIPTGGAGCSGPRPVLLYAHGTTTRKDYNIALLGSKTNPAKSESGLIAAMYAASGYIVIAPNYAGYDASTLGYHPYLNADQQSKEMIDALTAARKAINSIGNGTTANSELFLLGYSQGGHVAMATHRAMQSLGMNVTATSGGSGPYALSSLIDAAMAGAATVGSTIFTPLVLTSWQRAYKNIYALPSDVYNSSYADNIETLLPGSLDPNALLTPPTRKLPLTLVGANPAALVKSSFAAAATAEAAAVATACAGGPTTCDTPPTNTLRAAALRNDLRTAWQPSSPIQLCGGSGDATVPYASTLAAEAFLTSRLNAIDPSTNLSQRLISRVDVNPSPTFQGSLAAAVTDAGIAAATAASAAGGDAAAVDAARATAVANGPFTEYHGTVAPFCIGAAAQFFGAVRAAIAAATP